MTVGAFDAEDIMGPYRVFRAVGEANPGTPNVLVEGPWFHGDGSAGGEISWAGEFWRKNSDISMKGFVAFFFREYLKDTRRETLQDHDFRDGTKCVAALRFVAAEKCGTRRSCI